MIYSAIEITTNSTGVLCREERQEEKNGIGLQILKQVDNQEQISTPLNIRCLGEYWDKEGVHENGFKMGIQQYEDKEGK